MLDVGGVFGGQLEEGFVADAGQVEHGFLTEDFHLSGILEGFVEGAAEGVRSCCGGDDEMAGVVGAREHFVTGRGSTCGLGWWLEEISIFAVRPG